MLRTKIVCTIGPASREPEMLRALIRAGMDVARLNFSHGDHALHEENIQRIRAAAEEVGKPVAILVDLRGPKLRVGVMAGDGVPIYEGERVALTTRPLIGQRVEGSGPQAVLPVSYADLPRDVGPGERILIDDGLVELVAEEVNEEQVLCRVATGGVVQSNKGLNVPGVALSIPAVTEKDWEDLGFAIEQRVDWVALSFVRSPHEVQRLKEALAVRCAPQEMIRVIAKIEKPQALDHIEEIVQVADGIMVARGDLGIEIPPERVPMAQKHLIRLANAAGKPVITATQMLDSMIRNPRPTRAEASDVANAILDGTDALMLSGETAVGRYPLEAVRTMARIAEEVERHMLTGRWSEPSYALYGTGDVTDAVSHATCDTAYDLRAAAIIASTASGQTARSIAKYRPHTPIVAVTPNPTVQRQLMLSWGVVPLLGPPAASADEVKRNAMTATYKAGLVKSGQYVVITAGVTPYMPGTTNLMAVERVEVGE